MAKEPLKLMPLDDLKKVLAKIVPPVVPKKTDDSPKTRATKKPTK